MALLCCSPLSPLPFQSLAPLHGRWVWDQPPYTSGLFDGPQKKEENDRPWDYLHMIWNVIDSHPAAGR